MSVLYRISLIKKGLYTLRERGLLQLLIKTANLLTRQKMCRAFAKRAQYSRRQLEGQRLETYEAPVLFSLVTPLYNTSSDFLTDMLDSVRAQTYPYWELCLADGSDEEHGAVGALCMEYADSDPRIHYMKLKENGGISNNSNACVSIAKGGYIGLLDHDDILHPAALYEAAHAIRRYGADIVYTDEATFVGTPRKLISVHFKPDFAPDNLRGNNYICHFTTFSRALMQTPNCFNEQYDGGQDRDLILRLTEKAERICHIPKVLYYWRAHAGSVSAGISAKTYAVEAGRRAVFDHLARCGIGGTVESAAEFPTIYRIRYALKARPLLSIIIYNAKDNAALTRCIASISTKTGYQNYEIIAVGGHKSAQPCGESKKIEFRLSDTEAAHETVRLNVAALEARGEYLVFLDGHAEITEKDWLEELLMYAQRPDVGAVGGKICTPNGRILHAGIVLGMGALAVAECPHKGDARDNGGYMGRLCLAQNISAVSSACMMLRRELFIRLNGFDESYTTAYYDIDLCVRLREAGYLIVWTPYAEIKCAASKAAIAEKESDVELFKSKHHALRSKGDPYYNPNLSLR